MNEDEARDRARRIVCLFIDERIAPIVYSQAVIELAREIRLIADEANWQRDTLAKWKAEHEKDAQVQTHHKGRCPIHPMQRQEGHVQRKSDVVLEKGDLPEVQGQKKVRRKFTTSVRLEEDQIDHLRLLSHKLRIPFAALVRDGIDQVLQHYLAGYGLPASNTPERLNNNREDNGGVNPLASKKLIDRNWE